MLTRWEVFTISTALFCILAIPLLAGILFYYFPLEVAAFAVMYGACYGMIHVLGRMHDRLPSWVPPMKPTMRPADTGGGNG